MKTLPIPTTTVKNIHAAIDAHEGQFEVCNPLRNALRLLCDYDYSESISMLKNIESEHPEVLDFKDCYRKIKAAEKRYLSI